MTERPARHSAARNWVHMARRPPQIPRLQAEQQYFVCRITTGSTESTTPVCRALSTQSATPRSHSSR